MESIAEDLNIPLLPSGGDSDAIPRTEDPKFRKTPYQAEHGDSLLARANIVGITHGTMNPGGDPATLIVFEFRFLSMNSKRRYTDCHITIAFEDSDGDVNFCPEVYRVSPDGLFGILPTQRSREVTFGGNAGFLFGPSVGPSANAGFLWELKQTETIIDSARLSGTRKELGDSDKDDAVVWAMQENSRTKSGVPTFLRTAVLLRREADVPFNVSIKVRANVDFSLADAAADLRSLFGKKRVERVRPVQIDASVDLAQLKVSTLDPKKADFTKLDELDLEQMADPFVAASDYLALPRDFPVVITPSAPSSRVPLASLPNASTERASADRAIMDSPFQLVLIHGITNASRLDDPSKIGEILSKRVPSARILEFHFPRFVPSQYSRWTGLKEEARVVNKRVHDTCDEMSNQETVDPTEIPLIFMGHGFGGFLTKQIMLMAKNESKFHMNYIRVRGIIFFGTPHRGVDLLSWENHVLRLLAFSKSTPGSISHLLQTLPEQLAEDAEEFAALSWQFHVMNMIEGQGTDYDTVLDRFSASFDSRGGRNIIMSKKHSQLWDLQPEDPWLDTILAMLKSFVGVKTSSEYRTLQNFLNALSKLEADTGPLSVSEIAPDSIDWSNGDHAYLDWGTQPQVGALRIFGPLDSRTMVLSSHILKLELEKRYHRETVLLRYFFNKHDIRNQTQLAALISLCRQLLLSRPSLFIHVKLLCDFMHLNKVFTKELLWALFSSLVLHLTHDQIYCIVYRIDECEDGSNEMAEKLNSLAISANGGLKVIMTSIESHQTENLSCCSKRSCREIIDKESISGLTGMLPFVKYHVNRVLQQNPQWAKFEREITSAVIAPPTSHLSIMHKLASLESANIRSTPDAISQRLQELEDNQSASAVQQGENWIRIAFRWIQYAIRPLTSAELAIAVAFDEFQCQPLQSQYNTTVEKIKAFTKLASRDIVGDLRKRAGPLVQVVGGYVVPVHRGLQSHLYISAETSKPQLDPECKILTTCLEYMKSIFTDAIYDNTIENQGLEKSLTDYASVYWPEHYKRVSPTCRVQASQEQGEEHWTNDLRLALDQAAANGHYEVVEKLLDNNAMSTRALLLAAAGGHCRIVRLLLEKGYAATSADDRGYTALHHATCRGHRSIVEILAEWDNTILQALTKDGSSALCLAANLGQTDIVKYLLEHEADMLIEDSRGYDALKLAAAGGFNEIVKLLLNKGSTRSDTIARDGNMAMHLATKFHHPTTVSLLLQVQPDAQGHKNNDHFTPIHIASEAGFVEIARRLLDNHPLKNQNTPDLEGVSHVEVQSMIELPATYELTPLQLAAINGHTEIIEMLLNNIALLEPQDCEIALLQATTKGLIDVVDKLLQNKVTSNIVDNTNNSLLHHAIMTQNEELLEMLLEHMSDKINFPNNEGLTPLHKAAEIGNLAIVKKLVGRKAQLDKISIQSETPLHLAIRGNYRLVADELQVGMEDIDQKNEEDDTAFSLAVKQGHIEIVRDLLKKRIDVGFPFHIEVVLQHEKVLEALLRDGEWDCDQPDNKNQGLAPLHFAVSLNLLKVVELLQKYGANLNPKDEDGNTPLIMAASLGFQEVVDFLLEHDADIDSTNNDGLSPLYAASLHEKAEVVKRLLVNKKRPEVNLTNKRGWAPLHTASRKSSEITKLLLDHGAEPNVRTDSSHSTPLSMAAFEDESDIVRYLLEFKADPNLADTDGETAVHRAVLGGCVENLRILISYDAEINVQRNDGSTALHLAIIDNENEMVDLLLEKGVDTTKHSDEFGTFLMAAASLGRTEIADKLLSKGVDINEIQGPFFTALNITAYNGNLDGIEWLIENEANMNICGGLWGNALAALLEGDSRDIDIFNHLLRAGTDVGYINQHGKSILAMAVDKDWSEVVDSIINKISEKERRKDMEQAVLSATQKGHVESLAILLNHSENIPVTDKFGRSLLSIAIHFKHKDVVELLLAPGIDIDHTDHFNRTPVFHSVAEHGKFLSELLSHGADVNAQDFDGKTALVRACMLNTSPCVEALLEAKAKTAVVDCRGRGALYWACRQSSLQIFDKIATALREEDREAFLQQAEIALCAAIASDRTSFLEALLRDVKSMPFNDNGDWSPVYTANRYGRLDISERLIKCGFPEPNLVEHHVQLPSAWSSKDKTPCIKVDSATQIIEIEHIDGLMTPGHFMEDETIATIRADCPMAPVPGHDYCYFEVTIERGSPIAETFGVGFCEEQTPLNLMVGWDDHSWGYHGDDGKSFFNSSGSAFGETYTVKDVIGCGINFKEEAAFFTKNGNIIGLAFQKIKGKLYPAVSMDQRMIGAQMSVNFWKEDGPNDFVYKGRLDDPDTLKPSNMYRNSAGYDENTEETNMPWDLFQQNDDIVLEERDSD
uniref:Ankyrin-3 n=1 Tax=Talaromyces marneffei PM1 TaxID=1077442 RepID=A0A093X7X1_TALMA